MCTFAQKPKATPQTIVHLQRTIGNQAGQRLPQSNPEEHNAVLTDTVSPHLGFDFSRIPVTAPRADALQAKPAIDEPGDTGQIEAPSQVRQVVTAPGQPLNSATREFMEPRFGHDFSRVRIHADAQAAASAEAVNARAYTVGHNIVFGHDHYNPSALSGRHLLAHELAHVVQQGAAQGSTQQMQRSSRILQIGAQEGPVVRPVGDALPTVQRQASGGPSPASEAEAAVRHAQAHRSVGNILFDSWGNDVRDNDNDGSVDSGRRETGTYDGQHYSGTYTNFGVVAGTYDRGWADDQGVVHGRVIVPTTRTISGSFKYRVCADIVSQAYADAGLMNHMRSTGQIISRFHRIGTVWHNRSTFPSEYLPGDFVATYAAGHGGHSGIVTTRSPTSSAPTVIELPGPSTQADAGTYDPASTNDVKEQTWSKHGVGDQYQYLGRYTGRRH